MSRRAYKQPFSRAGLFAKRLIGVAMLFFGSGSVSYLIVAAFDPPYRIDWPTYGREMLVLAVMVLVLFLFLLMLRPVMLLMGKDPREVWREVNDAMRRIGRGDFQVLLDEEKRYDGEFGKLVEHLNDMARNLQQMELLRQEFISNVSHEIQSPFTSLRGFAAALQNEALTPEERRHYLSIIESESIRLSRLSDNLLKLTSLESEHYPFDRRIYRLDAQIRHLVLACEPQWLDKQLDLELDLEPVKLEADEDLLNQVWTNLIQNAIKFTPEYGSLHIGLVQQAKHVVVTVTDSGPGIAEEDLPRIFERFYKGDKSRSRAVGGSGLGLSIVKKAVELHGGTVSAGAASEGGACFRVELPVSPVAE